jgi:DNA-directed RNA polymerase subunit RPC12/RpoP
MALIHCSECGREISDQALSCPGCGAPTKAPIKVRPDNEPKEASPVIGIVAIGLGLASIIMPYFAAVFLVPAAFVCGIIAFRRGQKGLGRASVALAILGLISIISVSQRINKAQQDMEKSLRACLKTGKQGSI